VAQEGTLVVLNAARDPTRFAADDNKPCPFCFEKRMRALNIVREGNGIVQSKNKMGSETHSVSFDDVIPKRD
jgi:hypothetical protein